MQIPQNKPAAPPPKRKTPQTNNVVLNINVLTHCESHLSAMTWNGTSTQTL